MTAIIFKNHLIVGPQTQVRPYSLNNGTRLCGANKDFFALTSCTVAAIPLLNRLDKSIFTRSKSINTEGEDQVKLFLLHDTGVCCTVMCKDMSLDEVIVSGFNVSDMSDKDIADFSLGAGAVDLVKGLAQGVTCPHELVRLLNVMFSASFPCYSVVQIPLFLEWMKEGKTDWPFKIYPEHTHTEWTPSL